MIGVGKEIATSSCKCQACLGSGFDYLTETRLARCEDLGVDVLVYDFAVPVRYPCDWCGGVGRIANGSVRRRVEEDSPT